MHDFVHQPYTPLLYTEAQKVRGFSSENVYAYVLLALNLLGGLGFRVLGSLMAWYMGESAKRRPEICTSLQVTGFLLRDLKYVTIVRNPHYSWIPIMGT